MYSGVRSEFPLHVEQVLNGVGRPAIVDVGQDERSDDQGRRAFQATERTIPVQIQLSRRRAVAAAASRVACHIEAGIAGILSVEDAGARTHDPFGARVPGDSESRRKIFLVVSNQPLAEPAITRRP